MKITVSFLVMFVLIANIPAFSQSTKLANKYLDTAYRLKTINKDYVKALKYYDLSIKNGNHNNYTYYHAAQCACQVGDTEKAIDYYKKGFAVFIDYPNYDMFSKDTLIKCFSNTPDWKRYLAYMKVKNDSLNIAMDKYIPDINDTTKHLNHSALSDSSYVKSQLSHLNEGQTITWIRRYKSFQNPPIKNQGAYYKIKVSDTLTVPFFVFIPPGYDATKKNKLYIFLHGSVGQRPKFAVLPMFDQESRDVMKKQIDENAVILYPLAKKGFNWLYTLNAYEAILKEIVFVKSIYNIDDNKVYIGGHSDGGIGTFWFATHKPTNFASFLAMNYDPKSYFDNTNLANLRNDVKFYGISGDDDDTFDIKSVNNVREYGLKIGDNWHGYTLKGTHHLPYDYPDQIYFAYDSLFSQTRNPFPRKIQWETDNVKNGRYYWLEISQLDTLAEKSDWQKAYNPPSVTLNDKLVNYKFNEHKSGAIIAAIKNNTVDIQQSRVKELIFYASPELVDLHKPVKIIVNGKQVYNTIIKADKKTIIDEFLKTKDREVVIVNKIKIML